MNQDKVKQIVRQILQFVGVALMFLGIFEITETDILAAQEVSETVVGAIFSLIAFIGTFRNRLPEPVPLPSVEDGEMMATSAQLDAPEQPKMTLRDIVGDIILMR